MFLNRSDGGWGLRSLPRLSALRLTFSLLAVFVLVSALAWAGTYWMVRREMSRLVEARLEVQAEAVASALQRGQDLPPPGLGQFLAVEREEGRLGYIPFLPPDLPDGVHRLENDGPHLPDFRYLLRQVPQGRIIVAENTDRQEELRGILAGGMGASLLGAGLAGLLAGLWLAWRGQRRLDKISAGLAQVAQGQLDTRITLTGPSDDLSLLAERINTTTERLSVTVAQMRVQSSNIAHDLRTPLARLRAQIETSLIALSEQGRAVTVDEMGAALEQIDQITATFNALLRLAQIESGAGREGFAPVNLSALAQKLAETFGPVIEDVGQSLRLEIADAVEVNGDADLLTQLMGNLIQNALRYGPRGQTITLRLRGHALSVSDQGPGIPSAERERVLQPLYQMEKTRQNDGFGLGLAMVRAIAVLHDADLSLTDAPSGGLTALVRFPS